MREPAAEQKLHDGDGVGETLYKKEFWREENLKYSRPHYRMEKAARILNKLARRKECTLLDVGCGPATLKSLLRPNIDYYGIDIAIHDNAPNLIESDFLKEPIKFRDMTFDFIIAQGVFEYVGRFQSEKFAEIANLLKDDGTFVASYVNFDHRKHDVYWPYSNVRPFDDFRQSLAQHFEIRRFFATSHNWNHWEPSKRLIRSANMHINVYLPVVSPTLAVEYFLICSPRTSAARSASHESAG